MSKKKVKSKSAAVKKQPQQQEQQPVTITTTPTTINGIDVEVIKRGKPKVIHQTLESILASTGETFSFLNPLQPVYIYTVKREYLKECPDPTKEDAYNHVSKFKIQTFYHNTNGPAIYLDTVADRVGKTLYGEYWLNGKRLSAEEAAKAQHDFDYNNTFTETLNIQDE